MRKKIGLYLLFFLIIIFDSCRGKGKWDDNIHLSIRYVEFSASGDSITIKTLGSAWWIGDISVDDKWYSGFASIDQIHRGKLKESTKSSAVLMDTNLFPSVHKYSILRDLIIALEVSLNPLYLLKINAS